MRALTFLLSFLMVGCINAEAPYKYLHENDANSYTGEVIMQTNKPWSYVGSIKNGKPHGHGVKITREGMVIYGEWVDGEQKGKGAVYQPAPFNSLQAGRYENGTLLGEAVMIMDGEAIEGPFGKYGIPHGKASCTKGGVKKECEFNHGERVE